ncbi:MAG: U32 family peptidase [Bacteroidaceae bacterium]|nr:U32 family peptidase [Bacteroidaceae bacterium]
MVNYAHIFGAKVYVTVNTLLHDDELHDATILIKQLHDINVDAVLIQDLRLLNCAPHGLVLHASTQTDNRSIARVKEVARLGFKRVVVAREMPLADIQEIHRQLPNLEIECFVHGALCVSYSGACYASEYCFRRSANRGECAQFCRLPFDLVDSEGKIIIHAKHLLSLKDMCRIDSLAELADAGVCSFKIEGRLKDVDYVKNVTAAYSNRLNSICQKSKGKYTRSSKGKVHYYFTPDLKRTFNRGYTEYFLYGRKHGIGNFITPKSIGKPVGKVKDRANFWFSVSTSETFTNGDGLCFINEKKQMQGFRINKVDGNRLIPQVMPPDLKKGTLLFRNHDEAFTKFLKGKTAERKLPVKITLQVSPTKLTLTMTEGSNNYTADFSPEEKFSPAKKPQDDNIKSNLEKLGNTPFLPTETQIHWVNNIQYFIPISVITALRQKLLHTIPLVFTPTLHPITPAFGV